MLSTRGFPCCAIAVLAVCAAATGLGCSDDGGANSPLGGAGADGGLDGNVDGAVEGGVDDGSLPDGADGSAGLPLSPTLRTFWVSQPVDPDETMLVTGAGLVDTTQVQLAQLADGDPGAPAGTLPTNLTWTTIPALTATGRSLSATVPAAWDGGVYALRVSDGSAVSPVQLVNAPDPWFVQGDQGDTAQPGGYFYVAGRCLERTGGVEPRAALVQNGSLVATLPLQDRVTTTTGYGLRFAVPANVPEGVYDFYIHNGRGGDHGWVKFSTFITAPLETVTIKKAVVWPSTTINVSDQAGSNDDERFAAALAAVPAEGGRVFVAAGTYHLTQPLELSPRTLLVGAGRTSTTIQWTTDPGAPLVTGKFLGYNPDYTKATFSIEDLTLRASDDFTGHMVERVHTQELGWFKRVGFQALSLEHDSDDGGDPTALFLATVSNTLLEDLVLDANRCIFARENVSYLRLLHSILNWRNVTVQLSGGDHNVLIADNTINQRGDSNVNGWASESNPNPGLIVAPWYGRGWVSGPFTRDILYAGNVTTRDAEVAESPPGYVGYTSDGGEGMYLGKVASVAGTTLHLAGPTRIPMSGDDPPQPVSYEWAGAIAQILDGRGAGQWRFLTVEKPGATSVEVDRPWDIEPDASSIVTLVNLTGRTLLIDNDFAQAPLTQDYFLTLDNIRAGNRFGVEGTSSGVVSWAGNAYSGTLPAWHYQMLSNQVVRGPHLEFVSQNLNFFDAGYGGVLGAGHVYRNNTNSSDGGIVVRVGSRENTFADMVIEHNQADTISFENLNPPAPYMLSGVLVRNNQLPGGTASTVLPAGVIDGVTVIP